MSSPESLYERIGGEETVEKLIWQFYDRVLADSELAPFFARTPMDRQRRLQREFFAAALGGPQAYSGLDIRKAHHHRGIERRHLTRFVEHLLATLKAFNLSERDIDDIIARIGTYSGDVLGEVGEAG